MTLNWPYPFWIAHRGAGRQAPENTLAALRHGHALGWRAFEVDAKISADRVPFLMHDTTLDRTTTEHGRAGDRPWSELQNLDAGAWHQSEHAFEPIPSLAQVLNFVFAHQAVLNIEIKPTPGEDHATGEAVAALALQRWKASCERNRPLQAPLPTMPILSSFQPLCLRAAQATAPALPRALLINQLRAHWMDEAVELGCCACVVQHELVDAPMIEGLKARGLKVWIYTVNEPEEARRLAAWGVDGLITDAVHLFDPEVNPRVDPSGIRVREPARS
ncbi:MAG: glycerophosphodiester phosphodiesterase [Betaproteobacteria bacterium]|nr:glycerophosphodiester phosphodiesterase [Betaproteobacteria bacterium]NBT09427.1 glycerophosphodiester phosphodiesterase [Betaproteobacteria bacterium]NBU49072.1 glycerophosphodiester phosphodiesterase [Betaproteobacteria bacterium]NBX97115.1 glycerophosphodiester phosphodiesterase [Betaproteobacteria bacterium]